MAVLLAMWPSPKSRLPFEQPLPVARRWPARWSYAILPLLAACDTSSDRPSDVSTWITETEFEIGDATAGEAVFSRVTDVRVTPDGERVVVLEAGAARLTVWAFDGSLVVEVGQPGEGPGDLQNPNKVELHPEGLLVRDSRRFTLFDHDGNLVRTVAPPPSTLSFRGFRLQPKALLEEDWHLAVPLIPGSVISGWMGDDPLQEWPVLFLRRVSDRWAMDTVVVLDRRNSALSVRPADGSFEWGYHGPQPYSDSDWEFYDSRTRTVVVVKRNGGSGEARLVEVTAMGDTIWDRSVEFPTIPIPSEKATTYVAQLADQLATRSMSSASPITRREAVTLLEEALYLPEFYPAVDYVEGMSEGEVWLRTHEEIDTLQVWYSVRRGDTESPPRRTLLPRTFYPSDVSDTHVWGIRYDSLGVNYVVGRRLVREASGQ